MALLVESGAALQCEGSEDGLPVHMSRLAHSLYLLR